MWQWIGPRTPTAPYNIAADDLINSGVISVLVKFKGKFCTMASVDEAVPSTYNASPAGCLIPIPFLPIIANDTVDIDDEEMEVDTIGFDRIAQFYFYGHVVTAIELEQVAFQHSVRGFCSPLVEYRVRFSYNLSFGLFNICDMTERKDWWRVTKVRGWNIDGCPEDVRRLMFVHIIATLGCSPVVTDEDMDYPKNWLKMLHGDENSPSELVGHRPDGRTVCIHSIAVCPRLQGLGLGTATLKSYVQRLNSLGLADRVALICRKSETRFFQKCGFRNIGRSDTKTLPGEFYNMVFDLPGRRDFIDWNQIEKDAQQCAVKRIDDRTFEE
ncbi:hypothetical protein TsFJ059_000627 [Trichoderma semiorbis]|uniref:N-acetyltransferase domain-containing protein n=1 Tax=Trichoderma semiorbis TaxID=1491008 RepID=A0A9P8KS09_9HYPO|nr:hypothetical protein TsFJ059_000627 [Trichoderma semiorbis]